MEQINIFMLAEDETTRSFANIKLKKKRVRYKTPTFLKEYKIFKDDNGITQDQVHIYRYKTLYKIYEKILNYINYNLFAQDETTEKIGLLRVFYDKECGNVAEIIGTGNLNLKERLLIHIRLLRLLKQNIEPQKACKKTIKYWYKLKT